MKAVKNLFPLLLVIALLLISVTQTLAAPPRQGEKDVVDTAVADGRFTTLATALTAAGLIDTLKGAGPFTVFAPTDEAFAKLPAGALEALLADKEALTKVLLYHVVAGSVPASEVVKLTSADTVAGLPVAIKVDGDKVMLNDAQVIIPDVAASNGIIHVIDTVLMPPAEEPAMAEKKDIVDTAVADGRFTTLATALTAAGLIDTLKGAGPFTVFAPTDEAFAKLPAGALEALLADKEALTKVLLYHVVSGDVKAADVVKLNSADTVAGLPVAIKVDGDKVMVGDAQVIIADVAASNGTIHVIDTVLLPPAGEPVMAEAPSVAVCAEVYTVQGGDTLGKISEKYLGSIAAYNQIVEATNAAAASDSQFSQISDPNLIEVGVAVCIPGEKAMAAAGEVKDSKMAEGPSIVDIAVKDGRFKTLVSALTAAGLVETLQGAGPFTVFAPTDDAFAKIPAADLNGLIADKEVLTKVLLYHVVPGKVMASDVVKLASADTVEGSPVGISIVDGKRVFLNNNSEVIITDIQGSNGVIHVIDNVLFPPADDSAMMPAAKMDIVDTAVADGRFTTLATALTAAGLIETLKGAGPFTVFAPTDEAFAKLPAGTLEALLADKEALTKVLLYHVVPGSVMASDVVKLDSATTVEGSPVDITVEDGKVMVNGAQVIITDVATSNGVIHVIDTVLLPPAN